MKFKKLCLLLENDIKQNIIDNISKINPQDIVDILGGDLNIKNAKRLLLDLIDDISNEKLQEIHNLINKYESTESLDLDKIINQISNLIKGVSERLRPKFAPKLSEFLIGYIDQIDSGEVPTNIPSEIKPIIIALTNYIQNYSIIDSEDLNYIKLRIDDIISKYI